MSKQLNDQEVVDAFNRDNMIGAHVQYWTGVREGRGKFSTTRTAAELNPAGIPVVWIVGQAGYVALSHVEPVPHQMTDLNLEQLREVSDLAYRNIVERYAGDNLPSSVREHFETDVPVLIRTVNDLTSQREAYRRSLHQILTGGGPLDVRFGIQVDHDNGFHVRFRLFASTGLQHLGSCGPQQVMRAEEFEAFRALLGPALATEADDRSHAGLRLPCDPCGGPCQIDEQEGTDSRG